MRKVFLALTLVLFTALLFSHTSGITKQTCPICGKQFEAEMDFSGSSFGQRLDLKPIGPTAAPWHVAVCPQCGFVLYKENLSKEEKEKVKILLDKPEYKALLKEGYPSYYLLAKILSHMGSDDYTIAFTYIQASWQVEDLSPDRYRSYLQEAMTYLQKVIATPVQEAKEKENVRPTAQFLTGEILRQLSRFDEAQKQFATIATLPEYKKQPFRSILEYEKTLVAEKVSVPKEIPEIKETLEDKKDSPEYKMCFGLKGIENVLKILKIESNMGIGYFFMGGYSLSVDLSPTPDNKRLVDAARWNNPVDEKSQKAQNDWNDFLKTYEEVNNVASKHKWLMEWKKASVGRTIEAQILGTRPYTEDIDTFVLPAWRHAGLKGRPEYQVLLRRNGEGCSRIYFSKNENRVLIESADPGDGGHWLDKQDFSFHPTQDVPQYIVVDPDGKWQKNQRKK